MIYCVDLDGTLIKNDMSVTSFWYCIRHNPFIIFMCIIWYFKGKRALLKLELSKRYNFSAKALNYNESLISWLKCQASKGDKIYLISGSTTTIIKKISDNFDFFSGNYGSTIKINLTGTNKLNFITKTFSSTNEICYIGNSKVDLKVWLGTSHGIIVSNDDKLIQQEKKLTIILKVFRNCW